MQRYRLKKDKRFVSINLISWEATVTLSIKAMCTINRADIPSVTKKLKKIWDGGAFVHGDYLYTIAPDIRDRKVLMDKYPHLVKAEYLMNN